MFRISFVCLLLCTLHAKFQKKLYMPSKLLLLQNSDEMAHLSLPTTGTSFGNFMHTTIICNDYILHYHILYQTSSLEANLSLKDMKQLCTDCRQKPVSQTYTYSKTNN